jgi:hypothetical protein
MEPDTCDKSDCIEQNNKDLEQRNNLQCVEVHGAEGRTGTSSTKKLFMIKKSSLFNDEIW